MTFGIDKSQLKENGLLIRNIPKEEQTVELCKMAINQNINAFKYISKKCMDYAMCKKAVESNVKLIKNVPASLITDEIVRIGMEQEVCLLKNYQNKIFKNETYVFALQKDTNNFKYIPHSIKYQILSDLPIEILEEIIEKHFMAMKYLKVNKNTVKVCIKEMEREFSNAFFMSEDMKKNIDIVVYQKNKNRIIILDKYYDKTKEKFIIKIKVNTDSEIYLQKNQSYVTSIELNNFNDFYDFLDGNLENAELIDYDFKDVNINDFNVKNAVIKNKILKSYGLYDEDFYTKLRKNILYNECEKLENVEELTLKKVDYPMLVEDIGYDETDGGHIPFFYISDIHLGHRIIKKMGDSATKEEIMYCARYFARRIIKSAGTIPYNSYLLVAGDTSANFEITKAFFIELSKLWSGKKIVVILGNHELRDPYVLLEDSEERYRKLFESIGIIFLQNSLFLAKEDEYNIITEKSINKMDIADIRKLSKDCSVLVLGGIGFSGLNKKYNAVNLGYGKLFDKLNSSEEILKMDLYQSNRFDKIYKKINLAIPKSKVIILTHMKKSDWNKDRHNRNWIYLNGHDHRNYFENSEEKTVYADNQIGYKTENMGLKYFYIDNEYDIFKYYKDGIYLITKSQYEEFNKGKRIQMSFRRNDAKIYMIKNENSYMFFCYCKYATNSKRESLYLLNGGSLCKLAKNGIDDLQFYYENMSLYVQNICKLLEKYTGVQNRLAMFIKNIGGSGKVHGCIIDVDRPQKENEYSYCHLFVNPLDGKVTPYYANDVKSRYVYRDLITMLEGENKCKKLLKNYKKLEKINALKLPIVRYSNELREWQDERCMYDEGSYLYKISRIIKSLQYVSEKDVIRLWNEAIIDKDMINRISNSSKIDDITEKALIMDT